MNRLPFVLLVVLTLFGKTTFGQEGAAPPAVVGSTDTELLRFVKTRASKLKPDRLKSELERFTSKATPDWSPTLRAIRERPVPPYARDASKSAQDARRDELFWRQTATRLLGVLQNTESLDQVLLEGDAVTIGAYGALGAERAVRILLDPSDPLRKDFIDVLPRRDGLLRALASSGSPIVRDALIEYGQAGGDGCEVAQALLALPRSPQSEAFVKSAHLDAITNGSQCALGNTLHWGDLDLDLVRWVHAQYAGFRNETGFVDSGMLLAQLGSAEQVAQARKDVGPLLTKYHKDTLDALGALAERCKGDANCYLKQYTAASKNASMPAAARGAALQKAPPMIAMLGDAKAKEALLEHSLGEGRLLPPELLNALLDQVSPAFTSKHAKSRDLLGLVSRTRQELTAVPESWKPLMQQSPSHPRSALFSVKLLPGSCDIRQVDWKNATFADARGKQFPFQSTEAWERQSKEIALGDLNGDGAPEAVVPVLYAGSPGAAGMGGMATEVSYVFTVEQCTVRFVGSLSGRLTFEGPQLIQREPGVVKRAFELRDKRLSLKPFDPQTAPASQPCSNSCVYNSSCVALSTSGRFANCCAAVGLNGDDLEAGARCRWLQGH